MSLVTSSPTFLIRELVMAALLEVRCAVWVKGIFDMRRHGKISVQ